MPADRTSNGEWHPRPDFQTYTPAIPAPERKPFKAQSVEEFATYILQLYLPEVVSYDDEKSIARDLAEEYFDPNRYASEIMQQFVEAQVMPPEPRLAPTMLIVTITDTNNNCSAQAVLPPQARLSA